MQYTEFRIFKVYQQIWHSIIKNGAAMASPGSLTTFEGLARGKELQYVTMNKFPLSPLKVFLLCMCHTIDTTQYCDTK